MAAEREIWQVDDLLIDVGRQRVERHGAEIELPPLSFRLLLELARAAPDVLSFDDLMARVWTDLVVGNDTISQRVKLLREVLGDSAQNPKYIAGLRGRGYVLAVPARRIETSPALVTPVPAPPSPETSTGLVALSPAAVMPANGVGNDPAPREQKRRWLWPVIGIAALLLLAGAAWLTRAGGGSEVITPRLVVVPFQSIETDPKSRTYAAGVSEELLGILSRIPGLQVIAVGATDPAENGALDLRVLGERHGATYVLSGSVRYAEERLRVIAHLVRVSNGEQVWSESYEHPFADLLKTQKDIAAAVGNRLSLELGESIRGLVAVNPRAQENHMQAEYLFKQNTAEAIPAAMALLRESVALEPEYAAAWERLAAGYQFEAQYGLRPVAEAYAEARTAATRSIAADPDYGRAHVRLGNIALLYDRDPAAAARHMSRGLGLNPGDDLANGMVAILLRSLGRAKEAVAYARFADSIGTVSLRGQLVSGYTGLVAGDLDFARFRFGRVIELNPQNPRAHYLMGLLELVSGDPRSAASFMDRESDAVMRSRGLAVVHHTLHLKEGEPDRSAEHLQAVIAAHANGQASAYAVATVLAWRGDKDAAFEWLDRAAADRDKEYDRDFIDLLVEPLLEPLRDDPRWMSYLNKLGWAPEQLGAIDFDPVPPPEVATD